VPLEGLPAARVSLLSTLVVPPSQARRRDPEVAARLGLS